MEGLGTTSNLNDLPLKLQQQGVPIEHVAEDFYDFTTNDLTVTDYKHGEQIKIPVAI